MYSWYQRLAFFTMCWVQEDSTWYQLISPVISFRYSDSVESPCSSTMVRSYLEILAPPPGPLYDLRMWVPVVICMLGKLFNAYLGTFIKGFIVGVILTVKVSFLLCFYCWFHHIPDGLKPVSIFCQLASHRLLRQLSQHPCYPEECEQLIVHLSPRSSSFPLEWMYESW